MPQPAELLARTLATQPPKYADEKARIGDAIGPNEGDMVAVAETDPATWQGRLRGMGLEEFIAPYEALQPAPDTTYGTMLPIARDNATGDYRFALPTMARDVATGWLDMLTGVRTGEITPAASAALQATGLPMASPSGSLASGGALRQFQAATPYGAKTAAQKASIEAGRQAWMWKTPAGKFVVNAGKKPEGAKLVGRAIGDEWVSGPGLMAKAGSKEGGAAQAAGKSLPMDEASRMARAKKTGHTVDAYHGTDKDLASINRLHGIRAKKFDVTGEARGMNALGTWFSSRGDEGGASMYAGKNGVVYPVKLKVTNPFVIDGTGQRLPDGTDDAFAKLYSLIDKYTDSSSGATQNRNMEPVRKALFDQGHDAIVLRNTIGDSKLPQDIYVMLNDNAVRSRFANFDPAKADSADLMASKTGSPELLAALLQQRQSPRDDVNAAWLNSGGI